MLVTPYGIVKLVSPPQDLNAESPIVVTGFPVIAEGMSNAPVGFVTYPVIVIDVPVSV